MSLAQIYCRAQNGIQSPLVTVETHLANGLPGFSIVGLPDTEVKESKDRVRAAILNANFEFPARRITVNLAPADLPKQGGRFDLAIALGILIASHQLDVTPDISQFEFIAELALGGELRPVPGILPAAMQTAYVNRTLVVASANADEASYVSKAQVITCHDLLSVCALLSGQQSIEYNTQKNSIKNRSTYNGYDLKDVHGQSHAKRALEIAAAGNHSLLMLGPPGTGKTMLASRLPGILPAMTEQEALETASIYSISTQKFDSTQWRKRPFRAPHHTASAVALVGGGSHPRPGEISLAHNGVLFLDELPEFDRKVLEVLREPLESGKIAISRAARQAEFPAQFQFIAAMNPCPCGYAGHSNGRCRCSAEKIQQYRNKLSGPLLDRIDMHIEVPSVSIQAINASTNNEESSHVVQLRVNEARERQLKRNDCANSQLKQQAIRQHCQIDQASSQLIENAIETLGLSARAYHRILKVARTIADLAGSYDIQLPHVSEAISYRRLDRTISPGFVADSYIRNKAPV